MTGIVEKAFRVERRGAAALITALPECDDLPSHELYYAAPELMESLKATPPHGVVFDISAVTFFKSALISFLLRCHMQTKKQGLGKMALAAPSDDARKLLCYMNLHKVWEMHATVDEALRAVADGD